MAPKPSNSNTYKDGAKLDVERLKKHGIQTIKVDLSTININTLSTLIGILSKGVKLYMELLTANRYHALNHRTIHLLSQGEVEMSATTGVTFGFGSSGAAANNVSDAEVEELLGIETKVEVFVIDKNKTRQGGAFLKCSNETLFNSRNIRFITKY